MDFLVLLQMHNGPWNGWPIFPFFFMLICLLFVFLFFFRGRPGRSPWNRMYDHDRRASESPLDILKKRYAKGEIDKEEYEERRRVLAE